MRTITSEELVQFLNGVEKILGVNGQVRPYGVSRILGLELHQHKIELGTNGSTLWLEADLNWPDFPEDATIIYAPVDSYMRGKLLEEGFTSVVTTQDLEFDNTYLVGGENIPYLLKRLSREVRKTLLEYAELHLDISGIELKGIPPQIVRRVYIHSRPDIRDNEEGSIFVELGTQRFTSEQCAMWATQFVRLVTHLEGCSFQ